jgi:hypothetical protein
MIVAPWAFQGFHLFLLNFCFVAWQFDIGVIEWASINKFGEKLIRCGPNHPFMSSAHKFRVSAQ